MKNNIDIRISSFGLGSVVTPLATVWAFSFYQLNSVQNKTLSYQFCVQVTEKRRIEFDFLILRLIKSHMLYQLSYGCGVKINKKGLLTKLEQLYVEVIRFVLNRSIIKRDQQL